MTEREAAEWLDQCHAFWQARGRLWQLLFDTDETGRTRAAPDFEFHINPAQVRKCWAQALRERGNGLTAEAAIEMMNMTPSDRIVKAAVAVKTLGLTEAGRKFFGADTLLDIELFEEPTELLGFWDFVRDAIVEPEHVTH
jgi:hypothetical protein